VYKKSKQQIAVHTPKWTTHPDYRQNIGMYSRDQLKCNNKQTASVICALHLQLKYVWMKLSNKQTPGTGTTILRTIIYTIFCYTTQKNLLVSHFCYSLYHISRTKGRTFDPLIWHLWQFEDISLKPWSST